MRNLIIRPHANPSGLCACGCGQRTPNATRTIKSAGQYRGLPLRVIPGHPPNKRKGPDYIVDPESGCWIWQHALKDGYGCILHEGTTKRAHRVIYESTVGPIPYGMHLHHQCKTRSCVNPEHMMVVDSKSHGRHHGFIYGARVRSLDSDRCGIVRQMAACGVSQRNIAATLGVSQATVYNVMHHRNGY